MTSDTGVDELEVLARPRDRRTKTFLEPDLGGETELAARFLGAAEALTRTIPRSSRPDGRRHRILGQPVDELGELQNDRLLPARQVVDGPGRAALGAADEPPDDIADIDEVAARRTSVLQLERLLLQPAVHQRRHHVS